MEIHKGLGILPFKNMEEWLTWLSENHSKTQGLWVKFAKKASGIPSITYEEAREGAIRYGWIDGLKNAIDDTYYALRFTPPTTKRGMVKDK